MRVKTSLARMLRDMDLVNPSKKKLSWTIETTDMMRKESLVRPGISLPWRSLARLKQDLQPLQTKVKLKQLVQDNTTPLNSLDRIMSRLSQCLGLNSGSKQSNKALVQVNMSLTEP